MRVTRTPEDAFYAQRWKRWANAGCEVCPCCGERKTEMEYCEEGVYNKAVSGGTCKRWAKGLFRVRYIQVDRYWCYTCGAEWESEPYEIV